MLVNDEGIAIEGVAKLTMHGETSVLTAESGAINADVRINAAVSHMDGHGAGRRRAGRFSGGLTNAGGTVESNGKVLETHVHTGVEPGSGISGQPQRRFMPDFRVPAPDRTSVRQRIRATNHGSFSKCREPQTHNSTAMVAQNARRGT